MKPNKKCEVDNKIRPGKGEHGGTGYIIIARGAVMKQGVWVRIVSVDELKNA